jgi:hypothetical protein
VTWRPSKIIFAPLVGCSKALRMAPGDSFLRTHGATLEPQGVGRWQLSYQVESFDYGERLSSSVDVALPIAGATRDNALLLCAVVFRGHKAPEPKQIAETSWAREHGGVMTHIRPDFMGVQAAELLKRRSALPSPRPRQIGRHRFSKAASGRVK